ncbi:MULTISPECIES: metallophosphoesterase family protein [Burkholderia]|uniref:metallophosphoesterase family protein n=1 Tax=Burkholderia TaxID=32008 RepID=UPI0009BE3BAE|nr:MULTISPECIES: metallophosphoesterase [Burkholderia]
MADSGKKSIVKMTSPYRILHISDVHFGTHFDPSLWAYVEAITSREKPNLIACTGDIVDHGGLFMLAVARATLEKLAKKSSGECVLRVVPGNHDRALAGNVRIGPVRTQFESLFGSSPISLEGIPDYNTYRGYGRIRRLAARAWTSMRLWKRWSAWRFRAGKNRHLPLVRDDDPASVTLIYLDSNHGMRLATGFVDVKQLMRLQAEVLTRRDVEPDKAFAPRIALLHHHPLPIPHASIKEGLTSFEPFLVLRNAGSVLRELNRCDVDLVLHGHKHFSSFGKLGYAADDHAEGEIAVLAAGSAGVTLSEAGRNSVNFIDVFPNGQMSYTSIAYGGGRGQPVTELFRENRPIHTIAMHKRRAFRRALEHHGQHAELISKSVRITSAGTGHVACKVEGLHADRAQLAGLRPIRLDVSYGAINPKSVKLDAESKARGYVLTTVALDARKSIQVSIDLNQQLTLAVPAVTFGYKYLEFNSYVVSEWEAEQAALLDKAAERPAGRVPGLDFTSLVVRTPARRLTLSVDGGNVMGALQPEVRVMRWSTYPKIGLDIAGEFAEDASGHWVLDAVLSKHEQAHLRKSKDNGWVLDIEYPMVGHRYDIAWPAPEQPVVDHTAVRRALAMRRRILDDSRQRGMAPSANASERLTHYLSACTSIWYDKLKSPVDCREQFAAAMFVYDDDNQCLTEVSEFRVGEGAVLADRSKYLDLPLGIGLASATMKTSLVLTYCDPELGVTNSEGAYIYEVIPDGHKQKWKVLVALPIYPLPLDDDVWTIPEAGRAHQEAIGVLTLASTAADSGLLRLATERLIQEDEGAGWWAKTFAEDADADDVADGGELEPAGDEVQPGDLQLTINHIWGYTHYIVSASCFDNSAL